MSSGEHKCATEPKTSPWPRCGAHGFYVACAYCSFGHMFKKVR